MTNTDSLSVRVAQRIEQLIIQDSLNRVQLQEALRDYHYISGKETEVPSSSINAVQKARIEEKKAKDKILIPVIPFSGDTIFSLFDTANRAEMQVKKRLIENNIQYIVNHYIYFEDSLKIRNKIEFTDIYYRDTVLMTVDNFDALMADTTRAGLAKKYRGAINTAIDKNVSERNVMSIAMAIGLLILLYIIIKLIKRLGKIIRLWVIQRKLKLFKTIKLKGVDFLDADQQLFFALKLIQVLYYLVLVITVYLYLPLVFSVFPPLRGVANKLFGFVWNPVKSIFFAIFDYLPNLFFIVIIFLAIQYLIRALDAVANEIKQGKIKIQGFFPEWAKPTMKIIKFLLYSFMLVLIFPYLPGAQSEAFKGVSVFIGVLISIGSSSAITNSIAGIVITYMRPFTIGDWVEVSGVRGELIERSMFVIRLRTNENKIVTIPNSSILANNSINLSVSNKRYKLIVHTEISIGYDVPWRKVRDLMISAAQATEGVLQNPTPFVLTPKLHDFYIEYSVKCYTNFPNKLPKIEALLNQNILDKFNEAGVEILSPHFQSQHAGASPVIVDQLNYDTAKGSADPDNDQ